MPAPAWMLLLLAATWTGAALLWRRNRRLSQALADARRREVQLATIVQSEPACVKTVSKDLRLLDMNPAGLELVEADSLDQVRGADLRLLLHPDHVQDFLRMHEQVFAGESVSLRFRIRALRGTERWMETFAAPLRDEHGAVVAQLAVTHDISARVAMEQRLVEARDAAIAGTRAKNLFLANLSHEIRTPMTAILGWTEVLQGEANDESREHLTVIERNGRHLLSLVDDLLDLSRVEAGKVPLERSTFDVRTLLAEVGESLRPRLGGRDGLELVVEAHDGAAPVVSDRKRVRQILLNLANNAIKFTPAGSVTLRLAAVDEQSVVLEVEDTGPGIAPDQLDRLYQAFEQGDAGVSRAHGGVGLGLAISRSLANLLGGALHLESTPGTGTRARLRLPRGTPAETRGAPERRPERTNAARDLTGTRVLLAEDGADNQRLVRYLLERAGCEVTSAWNGREAVAVVAAAGQPFDLILMDVQMPLLDGYSAVRALRQSGCRTPIVALTANAMVGDRERCLEAGCDDYLGKPVQRDVLLGKIAERIGTDAAQPASR